MEGQSSSWIALCLSSAAPNVLSAARALGGARPAKALGDSASAISPRRSSAPVISAPSAAHALSARSTPGERRVQASTTDRATVAAKRHVPVNTHSTCRDKNAAAAWGGRRDARRVRGERLGDVGARHLCFVVFVRGRKARPRAGQPCALQRAADLVLPTPSGGHHLLHRKHGVERVAAEGVARSRARRRSPARRRRRRPRRALRTSPPTSRPARAPGSHRRRVPASCSACSSASASTELAPSPEPRGRSTRARARRGPRRLSP